MNKTWKGINELIRSNNKSSTIHQIQYNNTLINVSKLIADTFNDFFTNVGPEVDNSIPKTPTSPLTFLRNRVLTHFSFQSTSTSQVMTILLSLDDNKSSGPSDIPIKILKIAAPIIVPHFVFNLSFKNGVFPDLMKLAKVLPIFKSGSKLLVTNYRPISLLSVSVKSLRNSCTINCMTSWKVNQLFMSPNLAFRRVTQPFTHLLKLLKTLEVVQKNVITVVVFLLTLKKLLIQLIIQFLLKNLNTMG